MYKPTQQDKAIIDIMKAMERAKKIGFGTYLQLNAMVASLGLEGSKLMLNNLKHDGTFYFSPQECQRMGAILDQAEHKAQLNREIIAQTVFADAKFKAVDSLNFSMGSEASSVSLDK
jgi:hypothetical protein